MNVDRLDEIVQNRFDIVLGHLSQRDIHPPHVLRETNIASLLSSTVMFVAFFNSALWFLLFFFLGMFLVFLPERIKGWRDFDKDTHRDWTAALARKYTDRSLRLRHNMRFMRYFYLMMMPTIICLIIIGLALDSIEPYQTFPVFMMTIRFFVDFIESYVEASVPLPPPSLPKGVPNMA